MSGLIPLPDREERINAWLRENKPPSMREWIDRHREPKAALRARDGRGR